MKKVKDTSKKVLVILTKVVSMVWIIAIAGCGLYVLDIIVVPDVIVKAFGIGLLLSATLVFFKSIK